MTFDLDLYRRSTDAVGLWLSDYFATLAQKPVRSSATPGQIKAQLPVSPPNTSVAFAQIMSQFDALAQQGLTHWNHPRFFAYFPCSTSPLALAAEQLAAAICQQGMLWQTSPLSTELEERMIEWMLELLGLEGQGFSGLISDTASTSTLSAVLMARERATGHKARKLGLAGLPTLRVYVSPEAHSSIKKAVWLAGLGERNVVEVPTGANDQLDLHALKSQIADDRAQGMVPAMIVGVAGGTSVGAFDDLTALGQIARDEHLYYHIDAAWAGVAAIVPEYRELFSGWELADSIVLNPHKWLMTGMMCSVFLVKDMGLLSQTMAIVPTYLQTLEHEQVSNFSELTPQLGRPFRSLKLWFVIQHYGAQGLAQILSDHVDWAVELCERLRGQPDIEIVTEPSLSLFSFALRSDELTLRLLKRINEDGRIYLTQTSYKGRDVIRFVAGSASCSRDDVQLAGDVIVELTQNLLSEN